MLTEYKNMISKSELLYNGGEILDKLRENQVAKRDYNLCI